jgi:hypothetical protein
MLGLWRCVVASSEGALAVLHDAPAALVQAHAHDSMRAAAAPRCPPPPARLGRRPCGVTVIFSRDALTEHIADSVAAHAARLRSCGVCEDPSGAHAPGFCTRHTQASAVAAPPPLALLAPFGTAELAGGLNEEQAGCVSDICAGTAVSLCLGPPGTGKTRTVAAAAASLARARQGVPGRQGVATAANVAALNVLRALMAPECLVAMGGCCPPRLLVSRAYYVHWHEHEYDAALWPYIHVPNWRPEWRTRDETEDEGPLHPPANAAAAAAPPMVAPDGSCGVLVCTFGMLRAAAGGGCAGFDAARHVSALLVDEASQAWAGLTYAFDAWLPNLGRLHLFGDHNQLPPALAPRAAAPPSGVRSLYDAAAAAGHARHALRSQYRMPRPLAAFLSRALYGAQLRTHAAPDAACALSGAAAPLCWRDVPHGRAEHPPAAGGASTSWCNAAEVDAVLSEMARIDDVAADEDSRVVLTPYVAQRAALEAAAGARARARGGRWDIKTVDAYQGREARHVILSLVRTGAAGASGAGFLGDARRANVALSRAAGTLTVVGKHAAWAAMRDAPLMRAFAQRLEPCVSS